ncbi:MAG: hemerythrin domain-containing protein [Chitinophagaceae bacterium]
MKEETKPIKRSEQLAPLSREHHDGLLFAWKIKQGLENKTPLETLAQYTLWFWRHHIKPHFYQEEKILGKHFPEGNPMAARMKDEHDHIRELVLGLDDQADKRSLQILCDLLNQHIRFEERELFVFLEQLLPPSTLDEIYRELEEHPLKDETWTGGDFWVVKKGEG